MRLDPDAEAVQVTPFVLYASLLPPWPPATNIVPFHVTQFAPLVKMLEPLLLAVHVSRSSEYRREGAEVVETT
jgi:hypothetical protein